MRGRGKENKAESEENQEEETSETNYAKERSRAEAKTEERYH